MTAEDDAMKFVPTIAISVSTEVVGSCVGERDVIVGTGFSVVGVTVNVTPALVPPPGVGEETATLCVPTLARSTAGITAPSWVEPMNVVVRGKPSQSACDEGTKPEPLSVIV